MKFMQYLGKMHGPAIKVDVYPSKKIGSTKYLYCLYFININPMPTIIHTYNAGANKSEIIGNSKM